jgi:hypothetical protein
LAFSRTGSVQISVMKGVAKRGVYPGEITDVLSSFGDGWMAKVAPTAVKVKKSVAPRGRGLGQAPAPEKTPTAAASVVGADGDGDEAGTATLDSLTVTASLSYVALNEEVTADNCSEKVVLLDALGESSERIARAVACGCRAIVLNVLSADVARSLGIVLLESPVDDAAGGADMSLGTTLPRQPEGGAARVEPVIKAPLPIVCIVERQCANLRYSMGVASELNPAALLPVILLDRLMALGYPRDMCRNALARTGNDFRAAVEWLEANGTFLLEQTRIMADLDSAVHDAKLSAAAAAPPPGTRAIVAPDSSSALESKGPDVEEMAREGSLWWW